MPVDLEKLAKLKKATKVGGSRRKAKKIFKDDADDSKLQTALRKLNSQTLDGVEEVNFFKEDGNVLHFNRASVQASIQNNTFAVHGRPQEKQLTDLLPNILPQLGSENLEILRQLAENIQKQGGLGDAAAAAGLNPGADANDDDDIPNLVEGENFDKQVD
ncbi:Egd1p [Ascoidea rubescens DSM 1968]|uniref:Nascent polypeptide-associated complex subunit beta n=1 Tax=Ascoidea rubescens DSM 1968 TaxID=1344418 RepID=A0A1D2VIT3_9ASCO|nr:NAC-domain-containing protein [Ascoidea rubescens DSM 1968]ODV61536.1 NAC-domain-containing protein [Ascoidea rubescens DSM 1968]